MPRIALTDLAIRKLAHPEKGQVKYRDTQLRNFGLVVGKHTKPFFVTIGTERRNQTVGRYPAISLSEARVAAIGMLSGPTTKSSVTRLRELVTAYLEDCEARLRPSSYRRFHDILIKSPDIGLDDADKSLAKTSHEIAAYKAMFNWAMREEITTRNPFAHLSPKYGERDRLLSDDEVAALWAYDHPPFSDTIKLLFLTGQRRGQFDAFDTSWIVDGNLVFPGDVMKGGKQHIIPLTDQTDDLLRRFIYTNGWSKNKSRMDKHTGVSDYVLHDIRRYFSTTMAKLGVPLHITEQIIDHRSQITGVAAIYNRHTFLDEMREAFTKYENHLLRLVSQT